MPHVEQVLKHFHYLEGHRVLHDTLRERVAEVIWPDADDFFSDRPEGEHRSREIYDSTGAVTLERFAAAEESLLTPRAQRWHLTKASDEDLMKDTEVKEFFEGLTRKLFEIRSAPRAGYYSQKHVGYKSLGAFGDECLYVAERRAGKGIHYEHCHANQIFYAEDHERGIDTVYRKFPFTAKQAEQMWGNRSDAELTPKIVAALKQEPFKKMDFVHAVIPNPEADPDALDHRNRGWLSYYISLADKQIVQEGGYHEMPYICSRYTVNPNEVYGRGPAMLVLPSLTMLQEMQKDYIRASHKSVDPPLLLHDEGAGGQSQDVVLYPGGLNYGAVDPTGKPLIIPLDTGVDLAGYEHVIDRERDMATQAFLAKVSLMKALTEHPDMTATAVLELRKEVSEQLAPAIGRQQSEMLGPQIQREIAIGMRGNWFGEIPRKLIEARGRYDIEYVSEATRLQRAADLVAIDRTVERALALTEADPTAIEAINSQEVIRVSAEIEGAPEKIIATDEQLAEKEQRRKRREQAEQTLQALERGAPAMEQMSRAAERAPAEAA